MTKVRLIFFRARRYESPGFAKEHLPASGAGNRPGHDADNAR